MVTPFRTLRIGDESGSALLLVLVILTVVSLLAGVVVEVYVIQHRFIQRDIQQLQARYAAEAGLHFALARLEADRTWRVYNEAVELPGDVSSRITVKPFGVFIRIISEAAAGHGQKTLSALVGEVPEQPFHNAIILGDRSSGLNLAGHAQITGEVRVGMPGVRFSILSGRNFSGWVDGPVRVIDASDWPLFDGILPLETRQRYDAYLQRPELTLRAAETVRVRFSEGDLHLSTTDHSEFDEPILVIARKDLILDGSLVFQPGSQFVAGGKLYVKGGVTGRDGMFYGREGVFLSDSIQCAGQFFSDRRILVTDAVYLRYPSVLYVSELNDSDGAGLIEVTGHALVDGSLLYVNPHGEEYRAKSRVVIGADAVLRGSIYNSSRTELTGTVLGSVATYQFGFYESPTEYVNWLKDARVDVGQRPLNFLLPIGFSRKPRLEILTLDEEDVTDMDAQEKMDGRRMMR